jgi:hypothetical protein
MCYVDLGRQYLPGVVTVPHQVCTLMKLRSKVKHACGVKAFLAPGHRGHHDKTRGCSLNPLTPYTLPCRPPPILNHRRLYISSGSLSFFTRYSERSTPTFNFRFSKGCFLSDNIWEDTPVELIPGLWSAVVIFYPWSLIPIVYGHSFRFLQICNGSFRFASCGPCWGTRLQISSLVE